MGICPECFDAMNIIGTEKFSNNESETNFSVDGIGYTIMTVWHCPSCEILVMREPKKVFG